jgi:hypothetical protein
MSRNLVPTSSGPIDLDSRLVAPSRLTDDAHKLAFLGLILTSRPSVDPRDNLVSLGLGRGTRKGLEAAIL